MLDGNNKSRTTLVIVGCGATGWSAALAARKADRRAHVIVLEKGKYPMYERGAIPFVLQGDIADFDALIHFPPKYYAAMKIDLRTETTVTQIDAPANSVMMVDTQQQGHELTYDALILATGAHSHTLQVPGHTLAEVYGVRTLDDGRAIDRACATATSATVIGARLVGLEMAVALRKRGLEVTVIEVLPHILDGILDPELAADVQATLEQLGIHFLLGSGLSEILGDEHVEAVRAGAHDVVSDLVVMATGVRANTELAQQIGVTLGGTKLIKVNERMATNVAGVFAAGDCVECVNAITDTPMVAQLGSNAIRQGKVAGTNAVGGCLAYPKILGASITRLHDVAVASTGLTESRAHALGIDCVAASVRAPARPLSYPERQVVQVKLVANKRDDRLIGAQIISQNEVGPRIDALSLAILKQASVDDLILFDHAYSPPVAESTDPFSVAAEVLRRRVQRQRVAS
jgi:NADH oxidase (H2O2-forming)